MKSVLSKIKTWYPDPSADFGANLVIASPFTPASLKTRGLRMLGMNTRKSSTIMHNVTFGRLNTITVGERSLINHHSLIEEQVTIGNDVGISTYVRILTFDHEIGTEERRMGPYKVTPTNIGDGALIYSGATILPGCHVAEGCVIAAGAVVTKPTEPNGLYAGIPARRIRDLDS